MFSKAFFDEVIEKQGSVEKAHEYSHFLKF